jgi:hypothetical protein
MRNDAGRYHLAAYRTFKKSLVALFVPLLDSRSLPSLLVLEQRRLPRRSHCLANHADSPIPASFY